MNSRYLNDYPDVLTPEEAMCVLSIGRNKIYELLQSGQLPSIRVGKLYRIPKCGLFTYFETCYNHGMNNSPVQQEVIL